MNFNISHFVCKVKTINWLSDVFNTLTSIIPLKY